MKLKYAVISGVVLVFIVGWVAWWLYPVIAPVQPLVSPQEPVATASPLSVWGTFSGTIPCADCEGIKVILSLNSEGHYIDTGTFSLSEQYLGRSSEPFVTTGTWTILRGTPDDENATVIELTFADKETDQRYFLRTDNNTLEMLDADQNHIQSALDYSLTRQP
jgi:copper homeostasis protein (lipoprotein)